MALKPARFLKHEVTGAVVGWNEHYADRADLVEITHEEAYFLETGKGDWRPDTPAVVALEEQPKEEKKPVATMEVASGSSVALKDFSPEDEPPGYAEILASLETNG